MEHHTLEVTRLSAPEGEKDVIWSLVVDVSYLIVDGKRQIVLEYYDGSHKYLQGHQAQELWHKVECHDGCDFPCYYRHESDTAPNSCTECKLSEFLLGMHVKTRPDPIPPYEPRRLWDWKITLILCLTAMVFLLIAMLDHERSPTSQSQTTTFHKRAK